MPDIIITPSTGKLEFVDNSTQVIRRHSFTLDPNDLVEQLKLIIDQKNLQG